MAELSDIASPQELAELSTAGFTPDEINSYRIKSMQKLADAGYSKEEIDKFYGTQEPDMGPTKEYLKNNLNSYKQEQAEKKKREPIDPTVKPIPAKDWLDEIAAGFAISVPGLIAEGSNPSIVSSADTPRLARIAGQATTLVADLPIMIAGFTAGATVGAPAGAVAGSVIPGVGTLGGIPAGAAVGGSAGAFALPTAMRSILMQHYEKGDIKDFSDFWDRASATFYDVSKEAIIGAATGGAGLVAGKALSPVANAVVKDIGKVTAEIGTMVTVGKALEGEVPNADDFIDAAILVGGLHAAAKANKFRTVYERTGVKPEKVTELIESDASIKQEVLSQNIEVPKALEPLVEKPNPDAGLQTVYHGTNAAFEGLDYSRSGGMVFFAESADVASRYANDTGSGGRSGLANKDVRVLDSTVPGSDGPYLWDSGLKLFVQEKTGKMLTEGEVAKNVQESRGLFYEPKNARIIEQKIDKSKILDTYDVENLRRLVEVIRPTNKYIERLLNEAKDEISVDMAKSGSASFGGAFWQMTKQARDPEINSALMDFSKQMKEAGFDGIRFRDDQHPTVALFEAAPKSGAPTYTEAQQKILSKISDVPERTKEPYSFNKFYTDFVDKLNPLKEVETRLLGKVGAKGLAVSESPYKQARLVNDYKSKAKVVFEQHTFDFNNPLKVTGDGLNKILDPHLKDLDGFKAFIVADRAIELEGRGIKSGFDLEAAKQVVKEGQAKYGASSDKLIKLNHEMLRYLKDAGRLDEGSYQAILKKNQRYTAGFSRILDEIESSGNGSPTVLKEIKGSDLAIQDPLVTTVKNIERAFRLAETNRARKTFVDFALKNDPELIKKVEGRPGQEGKNEFTVWEDGKRNTYETTEPIIAETLKALDGNVPSQNFLVKAMRFFTAVKRAGITMTPDFIISNGIRDFITSGTFSKTSRGPFSLAADQLVAMGDILKKREPYYQWLKSGGSNGAFFEIDNRYIKNEIYKLNEQTGFIDKAHNLVRTPVEFIGVAANLIESAPRLAEFKRSVKASGNIQEGGFAAREITVDFQRMGAKLAALNSITAFQNVSIQGFDRTMRAIKDDPVGVGSKVAAYIVAPSVFLWYANHEDERYREIPRWEKDVYWHIITDDWQPGTPDELSSFPKHLISEDGSMVNKGTIYRIKKPQELGMVGSVIERTLEGYFTDNPSAYKDFEETVLNMVTPSMIPDAVVPPLEHMTNKNFFTGRPLIPGYLEKELPFAQYTEYTSETAKALGKIVSYIPKTKEGEGLSPIEVENYIRGWTGTLGMYAVQVSDAALIKSGIAKDPVKPAWTVADIPAVKTFVTRYPSASAQSLQDFYSIYDRNEKVLNTFKRFIKAGDEEAAESIQLRYGYAFGELGGIKEALANQSAVIRNVQKNPDMSPEEKRQIIESTYFQMIEIAKMGLEYGRALESQLKQDKDLEGAN